MDTENFHQQDRCNNFIDFRPLGKQEERKRKSVDEEMEDLDAPPQHSPRNTSKIVDSMKRVRISVSVGELRLRNDIEECKELETEGKIVLLRRGIENVSSSQMGIGVRFLSLPALTVVLKVPKLYPHNAPELFLLSDMEEQATNVHTGTWVYTKVSPDHKYFDPVSKKILLPDVTTEWSPIKSLRSLLAPLESFLHELYGLTGTYSANRINHASIIPDDE